MKNCFPFLILFILIISCESSENQEVQETSSPIGVLDLKLIDKGIKAFPVAADANFEHPNQPRVTLINEREYFSFSHAHMYDMFLYLYDYDSSDMLHKMTFSIQGPNAFNASIGFNYFVHTLDSIFVSSINGDYAIMNNKAEIIKKIGRSKSGFYKRKISFNASSYFDGTLIHTPTTSSLPYEDADLQYAWATLDPEADQSLQRVLPSRSFITNFDEITALRKAATTRAGYQIPLQRQLHQSKGNLYASTPISDSLYVFDKNYRLIRTIYAGVPGVDVTDHKAYLKMLQVKFSKRGMGKVKVLSQPPHFVKSAIDPEGKFIYRILIEKTAARLSERFNEEISVITKAQLIAIDLASGERYTYPLPLDQVDVRGNIFASSAGVHIRVKNQENEDEIQFRVFGPSPKAALK